MSSESASGKLRGLFKKKDKPKKTSAANVAGKSLSSAVSVSALLVIILFAVLAALLELVVLSPTSLAEQEKSEALSIIFVKKRIEAYVKERQKQIGHFAYTPIVKDALNGNIAPEELNEFIFTLLPDLELIYVVPKGRAESIRVNNQSISFAGKDLIRKAEQKQVVKPDAYYLNGKWHYQIVAPIKSESGVIIGSVLAIFNTSQMRSVLVTPEGMPEGKISVRSIGRAKQPIVMSNGKGGSGRERTESSPVAQWKLHFEPQKPLVWELGAESKMVMIIVGFLGVIVAIAVFVIGRLSAKSVQNDLMLLVKHVGKSLGSTESRKCKGLVHADFVGAVGRINKSIKEYSEDVAKKLAKPSQATKHPAAPEKEDSDPLFDGDFLDIDEVESDDFPEMVKEVKRLEIDVPHSIFRAYDIRGIVDEAITAPIVDLIGKAFGSEAMARGYETVCVGYDGRVSSRGFCEALSAGIQSTGANVIVVGEVPTPVLYFATHELETGTGVMITGSHNPANYNGFKMMIGGDTLANEDIQKLYERINLQDFAQGRGGREDRAVDRDYLDTILNDIAVAAPLRVVVDCGNGVAGHLAPELIEELGCEVIPLYCDVDGTFPNHHPDPGKPENLRDLIAKVQEEGADVGLAFDGDGDRVGVVTNEGKIIWPDRLLMLFAKDVVSRNPGADIIYDVKCSRRLSGLISNYGGRPIMWKTGHSLIKAKMKETGALLAGEMSGHVFFKERWFGFDDGLYSAARLLEILGIDERSSSEVFESFPEDVSTPEINVKVTDDSKFAIVDKLCAQKETFEGSNVTTIDGLRVDFQNGWGLCRASNTTPMLVLRFEADDDAALEEIKEKFRQALLGVEPGLNLGF